MFRRFCLTMICCLSLCSATTNAQQPTDTKPLTSEGDLASQMVDGIDRFLLQQIADAPQHRAAFWNRDTTSVEAYQTSLADNRKRLANILGARDSRIAFDAPELIATTNHDSLIADTPAYTIYAVRWPVLADPAPTAQHLTSLHGAGLLLVPKLEVGKVIGNVVAIPHAGHSPEQLCGLAPGIPPESQYARRLAESGCRVIVPVIISRERSQRSGRADMTDREYLYRAAFELGRHLIGYEVHKVLAAVDWFAKDSDDNTRIGVIGYGEGGMLALYAGALDTRIDAVCVSGAMGFTHELWKQPLDRNVFGLIKEFGTTELAAMVQPRRLLVDFSAWPEQEFAGNGGAPAVLKTPPQQLVRKQIEASLPLAAGLQPAGTPSARITMSLPNSGEFCHQILDTFVSAVTGSDANTEQVQKSATTSAVVDLPDRTDAIAVRYRQQFEEIDRHNQALLQESDFVRKEFLSKLDTQSVEAYEASVEHYRTIFREDVIGEFDQPLLPFNARSRKTWDTETWTGHEVVLDVFPDVMAYGVLLLPKDLKPGEKRPVVVCQHGLEGRPTDTFLDDHRAYHDFAAKLCERGYITFAPQNPYIFQDRFRTLQRKANPLGKTLFSVIVPQHQQIVNWLKTQPFVDGDRIGFYGLSYGGKSAMRIPALVTDYALSICSADFNEWVRKNASTRLPFSYMWTGEYEIFEWDLGSTFNYFEMAALICPRPFMVERGHFDGVGTDEWVGYEFGKVRHLYAAKLGLGDRAHIEWFVGPHTINGQETFRFLDKHLK